MAKFNVDQPENQAPNFMNYSQERRGNRAWGTLFEGIGEAVTGGVKIADQNIQDNLYKEAEASVDQVRNLFGVDDGQAVGNGSTIPEGSAKLPPGFEQSKDYLSRLSQGYQNGTVTSSYYYGQLQANVKSLKAKYPGYEKQVDDAIQSITGVTPANAIISSLRQEAEAEAQKATQETNRQDSFINAHIDSVMATMPDLMQDPSKYTYAEIRENVGRYELSQTEMKNEQTSLALRASRQELTEGEVRQSAANGMTTISGNMISGALNTVGSDFNSVMTKVQDWQKTGHQPSPQELQDIQVQFGRVKLAYRQQAEAYLRQPFDPENPALGSMYSYIGKDQKKLNDILEIGLRPINDLEEAISTGNYSFVGMAAAYNKASTDTATKNIIKNDSGVLTGLAALKSLGGDNAVSIYMNNPNNQTAVAKAILNANVGNVIAGTPTNVNDDLTKAVQQGAESPQVGKDMPNKILNQHLNGIANGSNPEYVTKSAQYLFGQGDEASGLNINKLQSNQRASTYARFTTPAVTKAIQKAAQDTQNPQIWENYKNWSYQNFVAIARTTKADIDTFSANVPGIKAYVNPETMKIRVEDTGTGTITGPETGLAAAAQRDQKALLLDAYRNLNTVMGGLKGITQADGGDKNGALEQILKGMGLEIEKTGSPEERDMPTPPNLLDQARPDRGSLGVSRRSDAPDISGRTVAEYVRQIQSGTRRQPITPELENVLARSAATVGGVTAEVFSGGQDGKGEGRRRTGSTRHDHGNAADIRVKSADGTVLDHRKLADRPQIVAFIQEAVRNGATGIGAGPGYMGTGIHIGYGPNGSKDGAVQTWGAGGKARNAPKWLRDAVAEVTGGSTRVASR